ncbi:alpha-2-macroglobulin-like [Brienomyrus brachyistius]|uniref:alpha-2-macroglobulin-like n=1 Tax=Brienomyrus brachyistius TaxID=42636 RepID=UPI0020B3139E|nr:alpha-2-macroglobulin-like [Brienomyrus brachyistius]
MDQDFYECFLFQAPVVKENSQQSIEVEVQGTSSRITKRSDVMFTPMSFSTFIRTDKPVYKQGQTVHFRIFTVDENLIPVNQLYDRMELQSPVGHIIGQWVNSTNNGRILQMSFPLNSKAYPGRYKLSVWSQNGHVEENFEVKDYVLPRFQVDLKVPEEVNVLEKEIEAGVCGTYTYGKPVVGVASLKLCREVYSYSQDTNATAVCQMEDVQVNKMGCAFHRFSMSHFCSVNWDDFARSLKFTMKLEEEGTGVFLEETARISLNADAGGLSFVDTPTVFHHNSTFEGKIKAVDYKKSPIANMKIYLSDYSWTKNITTDANGIASFSLNTSIWSHSNTKSLYGNARKGESFPGMEYLYFHDAYIYLTLWEPSSIRPTEPPQPQSSLTIDPVQDTLSCWSEQQLRFQYVIFEETSKSALLDLFYLVLSNEAITSHGRILVVLQEGSVTKGEASIPVQVTPDFGPFGEVLVYSLLPSKIVIANSMRFKAEKCFRNKVSLQFSHSQAVPGEGVNLQLRAQPGSVCGLSVVDKSVLLMDDKRLNVDKFNTERGRSHVVWWERRECLPVRAARSLQDEYVSGISETSIRKFKEMGLKIVSSFLERPQCVKLLGIEFNLEPFPYMRYPVGASGFFGSLEKPRIFFPETWVWDLIEVGESGSSVIHLTAPDTITTWETEAFCLSKEGLGLATPPSLTVFQPFFVELTLPHSIIRGERFELKATVVNYELKCIMVTVTPAPSSNYILEPFAAEQYSTCVCQWKIFRWILVPSVIGSVNVTVRAEAVESQTVCDNEVVSVPEKGRVDIVTRSLLIKAEGTEKTVTHGWLLCPQGAPLQEEVMLQLPADVVEGSARAAVSVIGDILGRALQNLDGMLAMPYGCGEQNMALLAPNIYIMHYLKATEQLDPIVLQKATHFLNTGYQRQLRYLHVNGAFSTFGHGTEVNSWLTAFVMRSLGSARSFMYVEPKVINGARTWLQSQQKKDGCFKTVGTLFNKRMKGGVMDDVTLTAYISASMLELNTSASSPALAKSLICLRKASHNLSDIYTTALLAYTFSLAQEMDTSDRLLKYLDSVASRNEGLLHWSPPSSEASTSLSVELTSYVLLAVLRRPQLSAADRGYTSRIAGWLVKQQNPQGGFFSTQDTVVALQALSRYATLVYSPGGTSTVSVHSSGGDMHHFTVDKTNKLIYQESELQSIPGQYVIEAQGSACVSVQTALYYNIPPTADGSIFGITASTKGNCTSSGRHLLFNLILQYNGPRDSTDMVIADVAMLSGFIPEAENLKQLEDSSEVDRVEIENNHVLLYFTKLLQNNATEISFKLRREVQVEPLKPATVKVYDYYLPSDQAVTKYTSVCAKDQ